MDAGLLQPPSSGVARSFRSGSIGVAGAAAGSAAVLDAAAMQQLAAVRQAQADTYRYEIGTCCRGEQKASICS
jgi:hypothetical protein